MRELESQARLQTERDKQLRFKSGQLFIKALEKSAEAADVRATPSGSAASGGAKEGEYVLTDDDALIDFLSRVEKSSGESLFDRLFAKDKYGTGQVTKAQFCEVLGSYGIRPQDEPKLLRIAGFGPKRAKVSVEGFMNKIAERAEERPAQERELFLRIAAAFVAEEMDLDTAFKFIDEDGSRSVTY